MEFRNLTPFDALAFDAIDSKDRDYHVVALSVGYALEPIALAEQQAHAARAPRGAWRPTHRLRLLDQAPHTLPLCLADTHWGEPSQSSLVRESDLVPYKPRCDLTVVGSAYCREPAREFQARFKVEQDGRTLVDKTLTLTGPRRFERDGELISALLRRLDEAKVYGLSWPEPTTEVPLRYELAFGGRCHVAGDGALALADQSASAAPDRFNQVCFRNPVGAGWIAQGYLKALARRPDGLPKTLPAPRISLGKPLAKMQRGKPLGALTPAQMAQVRYPHEVAGLSAIGKAWAPRLALAGTADEAWQAERAPLLPADFDFGFWNGAPRDQQIDFPDLSQGLRILAQGLLPGGELLRVQLPHHRAYALMRLANGLVLPNPMQIDLIELDNQEPAQPRLRLVFRTAVLQQVGVRALEARFEPDASKPLFTLETSGDYVKPSAEALRAELQQEAREARHG